MTTKKTAKKAPAKKKAEPKVLPPNPSRPRRATVRNAKVDFDTACRYISEYGFFLHKRDGKTYHLTADSEANANFVKGEK
tara:strand:- start:279 stop:518 length:240 start_codon:yes stop_codon:yes gene_type:complete